jgi:hypothetical protein
MYSPFKVIFVDILLYAEKKADLHRPPQVVHEPSSLGLQRPGTKDELLGEKKHGDCCGNIMGMSW